MSHRSWHDRLNDIKSCAKNIQKFTVGMTFTHFINDPKTIRAVAYELITIGEAVRAIPGETREKYPDIPWDKMMGIRNVLVHEYFRLDEEILWKTIQIDIPQLISKLVTFQ